MAEQMRREITFAQLERQTDAGRIEKIVRQQAAADDAQFVQRFSRLVEAVAFRKTCNERRTVDAKQVQALKKAWRDLEKNDLPFADRKKK